MSPVPDAKGVSRIVTDGVTVSWTSRQTGSFGLETPDLAARYREVAGGADVVFPRQVHGNAVIDAHAAGGRRLLGSVRVAQPTKADAVVSGPGGPAIAVVTADCAPVAIWTLDRVIGVAHAGWRGLVAGVIEATVDAVRSRSAAPDSVRAALGPCIGPCCYEFGSDDLTLVARRYGDAIRSVTTDDTPALDMRVGVQSALERSGCAFVQHLSAKGDASCTACGSGWYSWRRYRDVGRQALVLQTTNRPV